MEPLILIVDDEKSIRTFLRVSIERQGYKCIEAVDGTEALMLFTSYHPNIVLLDLGLPDLDGVDIIKKIREYSQQPIIVLSAREREREKIEALDAGADDYLTKPFSVPELLARIRVILRREQKEKEDSLPEKTKYHIRDLVIDVEKYKANIKEEELKLTKTEFRVLLLLAEQQGKVVSHRYITEHVWGSSTSSDTQSLRVCMGNLRRKLSVDPSMPEYIITEIGIGYRMVDE